MADYASDLLAKATQDYPFVARHNPMVVVNPAEDRGFAETYPVGETGAPLPNGGFNKNSALPIDRVGVEVFKPDQFNHHDLAAEMLHIDPMANQTREALVKSWTPDQLKTLKEHALDYQATGGMKGRIQLLLLLISQQSFGLKLIKFVGQRHSVGHS